MLQLNRISTKLGALFATLFVAMMVVIAAITHATVTDRARAIVSDQVAASSQVFTHLFVERGADLQRDTELQVRDYGFRSAITSEDQPTILSALETLRRRLSVDGLAFVDDYGSELAAVGAELPLSGIATQISDDIYGEFEHPPGFVIFDDQAILSGYVGVYAPNLIGFVVFGDVISDSDLAEIVALSPIPLDVSIFPTVDAEETIGVVQKINGEVFLRQELPALVDELPISLELVYPLHVAFQPFRVLIESLILVALIGAIVVSGASWFVARGVTTPISRLAKAADLVREGKDVSVAISSGDELEDLATAFNHMSAEIRDQQDELKQRARSDSETGLPNRRAFEELTAKYSEELQDRIVIAVGIDRFSQIRSALGFEASAEILRQVFKCLEAHFREGVTALVSDGVLVVSVEYEQDRCLAKYTSKLREKLNSAFLVQGNPIDVTVSIGIAPPDLHDEIPALKRAMIALDQARLSGEWKAIYDQNRYLQTNANLSLMGHLVDALERRHLYLEFQPKFDLRRGVPVGLEALVRWNDPDRGKIFPDQFIPLAEETGHIERLTAYVLTEAIEAQRGLIKAGFNLTMSVNLSARLVANEEFVRTAKAQLDTAPGRYCFEITETAMMANPDLGIAALQSCVDAGIEISIDDYGSGLSSLAYLKQLPAQELKIDKEFILEIDRSQRDAMLARSTIDLAHGLGMKVTAEGIESAAAVALLTTIGCDIGQGYHLARPMPLDRLLRFLKAQKSSAQSKDIHTGKLNVV